MEALEKLREMNNQIPLVTHLVDRAVVVREMASHAVEDTVEGVTSVMPASGFCLLRPGEDPAYALIR